MSKEQLICYNDRLKFSRGHFLERELLKIIEQFQNREIDYLFHSKLNIFIKVIFNKYNTFNTN